MARRVPSYRLHRPSGRAVVTLGGRDHYLGKHGTAESRAEYQRVLAEWLAHGNRPPADTAEKYTLAEVMSRYLAFCDRYYRKAGRVTSEVAAIESALRPVARLYADVSADSFTPAMLKTIRESMVAKEWARTTVNAAINRVRRMMKWATVEGLVPASTLEGLRALPGLRKGRSEARETGPIRSVPEAHFRAALPFMSPPVAAMCEIMWWCGCRPGEIASMRPSDIDRSGPTWVFRPASHKTEHHGHRREIGLGPRAQRILAPFLPGRDAEAHVFSPVEAEARRNAARSEARQTPRYPSHLARNARKRRKSRKRAPRDRYSVESFGRAIARAIERFNREQKDEAKRIPTWTPNRLRHSAATRIRREYGIEAARQILGHRSAVTSEIYAEADTQRALDIMGQVG